MLKTGPDVVGLPRQEAREARLRFWRETVAAALASGQTHTDYCRAQGISPGAYFWWKKVLTRLDKDAKAGTTSCPPRPKATKFLPVSVGESGGGSRAPYLLEIVLGGDRIVRVGEGCDAKYLEAVVKMVGDLRC